MQPGTPPPAISRTTRGVIGFALLVASFVLSGERAVHAYIDPGSGSLIYQALLAALLGAGFTFRRVLGAFSRAFRSRRDRPDAPPPDIQHS